MRTSPHRTHSGFSLIEVLVTVVVITVGVLGAVKMQTSAIASTQASRVRSLIALQAGSLASAMYGNSAFWSNHSLVPSELGSRGGVITSDSSGTLALASASCDSVACTPAQLAAHDLRTWSQGINRQIPGYSAAVSCTQVTSDPVTCTIRLDWTEKYVAINRSTGASSVAQTTTQSFTLHVQP